MLNDILPDFQRYLADRKLVSSDKIPFHALWVSKFLAFSNKRQDQNLNARIAMFLDSLVKEKQLPDWQVEQAGNAIRLYTDHFLSGNTASLSPDVQQVSDTNKPDAIGILGKLREAIRIKHYSYSTERTYLDWSRRFFAYLEETKKNSLTEGFDERQVRDFLSHLAIRQMVSSATQNQAFNALLFLFREVLKIELKDLGKTVRAKRGPKLPVVLTTEEVRKILDHLEEKDLLLVQVLYGTGMRLMELARLRVQDIDFGMNSIIVRAGKGDKDRITMMPAAIRESLRKHLMLIKVIHERDFEKGYGEVYLPDGLERKYPNAGKEWRWQYAFPAASLSLDPRSGKVRRHHISPSTIQKIVATAVRKAGIAKHATVHTLRHSFATHLLISGVNIREVQELLGHKNVETTMIYTHVVRNMSKAPESPLDNLLRQSSENEQAEEGNPAL